MDGFEGKSEKMLPEFVRQVRTLSFVEIDRNILEITNDMEFINAQVKAELENYKSYQLQDIDAKLLVMDMKLEILRNERERRNRG